MSNTSSSSIQEQNQQAARKSKALQNSEKENGPKQFQYGGDTNNTITVETDQQCIINNSEGFNIGKIIPYQQQVQQQQTQAFLVQSQQSQLSQQKNQTITLTKPFGVPTSSVLASQTTRNALKPTQITQKKTLSIGNITQQSHHSQSAEQERITANTLNLSEQGYEGNYNFKASATAASNNCPWSNSNPTNLSKRNTTVLYPFEAEDLPDTMEKSPKPKQTTKFPPIGAKASQVMSNQMGNLINVSGIIQQKMSLKPREKEAYRKNGPSVDAISRNDQLSSGTQNNYNFKSSKGKGGFYSQLNKNMQEGTGTTFINGLLNQVDLDVKGITPSENPYYSQALKAKRFQNIKSKDVQQLPQQTYMPNIEQSQPSSSAASYLSNDFSSLGKPRNVQSINNLNNSGQYSHPTFSSSRERRLSERGNKFNQDSSNEEYMNKSPSSPSGQGSNTTTDEKVGEKYKQQLSKQKRHKGQEVTTGDGEEEQQMFLPQPQRRDQQEPNQMKIPLDFSQKPDDDNERDDSEDNSTKFEKSKLQEPSKKLNILNQDKFDKTPQVKRKTTFNPKPVPQNNSKELDDILNDSISKAPLNLKASKSTVTQQQQQQPQLQLLPSLSSEPASTLESSLKKQKPQKLKKKKNPQAATKNKNPIDYSNLPKEVQRISQYSDFCRAINFSNNLEIVPQTKPCFKMFVGKGNNSILIKSSIKQRWWLQLVTNKDQIDQCQIVWTQLRMNELIAKLQPYNGPNKRAIEQTQPTSGDTKNILKTNNSDSFADSINDVSTNLDNSSQQANVSMNNGGESLVDSDSEIDKVRSFSSHQHIKKASSLNTSLTNLKSDPKKPSSSLNPVSPVTKEARSLTPSTRGAAPQNSIKAPISYNACTKRLFHPQDFKKLMDIQGQKNSELRAFFSMPLADQFAQAKKGPSEVETFEDLNTVRMHNHLENNWNLSNKKALFYNLRNYYTSMKQNPFDNIPLTFHIKDGMNDPEYAKFLEHFRIKEEECNQKEKLRLEYKFSADKQKQALGAQMRKPHNIWIIKPGEITNRGTGITVLNEVDQITQLLSKNDLHSNGKPKTYIVQKYLDNPLLYNKRKFDIRCYTLVTVVKGRMKAYWYQDGYIRTSCKEYNCKNLTNKMIHLTNDAVQNKCEEYGKYEPGNKLSYNDLQRYLDQNHKDEKINILNIIYPKMKQLALDCVKSTFLKMDPARKEVTFEVFGLDYMIDEEFKTWLIEVNTNPCLELSSPLLARIIPSMIENAFRIAIDPIFGFPPISDWSSTAKKTFIPDQIMENSKFELIFDEKFDGPSLEALFAQVNEQQQHIIIEEEEEEEEEIEDEQ